MRSPYYDARWRAHSRQHREMEPTCRLCRFKGRRIVADEVDHVIPHRGDGWLFREPLNLQSICRPCHSGKTTRDYRVMAQVIPGLIRRRPTRLVLGPPGAGKRAFVEKHGQEGGVLLDFDEFRFDTALWVYGDWLRVEIGRRMDVTLWVIASTPRVAERAWLSHILDAESILLATPLDVCERRIQQRADDPRRDRLRAVKESARGAVAEATGSEVLTEEEELIRAARRWWRWHDIEAEAFAGCDVRAFLHQLEEE